MLKPNPGSTFYKNKTARNYVFLTLLVSSHCRENDVMHYYLIVLKYPATLKE